MTEEVPVTVISIHQDYKKGKKTMQEDLNNAKSIIADQIRGEWEAIQNYNKAIDDLSKVDMADFGDVMRLLDDIADEEKQHVGELQQALSTIDNTVNTKVDEGKDEAEEKLANPIKTESLNESSIVRDTVDLGKNSISYGCDSDNNWYVAKYTKIDNEGRATVDFKKKFSTEAEAKKAFNKLAGIKEDLTEEVSTPKIDEIDKFIEDIYELRKTGLAEDGEYSIPNLVFKEIRNKGYLDNLKELKNKLIGKELSLESLNGAADELNEAVLKEDLEFGKYKDRFIRAILSQDATALHKGAESRKIYNRQTGELEDKLLWDSVLHHIDGNHENNPFDFSNYTLIQCDNYSTAMLLHRLIHLLSFAENGNAAEDIKNKIRSYDAEFVTLIDNRLSIQDFDSWWKDHGHIILDSAADKIANMQPGKKIVLEDLNESAETISIQDAVFDSLRYFDNIGVEPEVDEVIEDIAANVPGYEDWQDIDPTDITKLKGIRFEVAKAMNEYFNESLEQTVGQDLADNRQPVDNEEEETFKEPYNYKQETAKAKGLEEDTVKNSKGKWVNKGKEGTHGTFKTKKAADAQRKAMFANGYHEDLEESWIDDQPVEYKAAHRAGYGAPSASNDIFDNFESSADGSDFYKIYDLDPKYLQPLTTKSTFFMLGRPGKIKVISALFDTYGDKIAFGYNARRNSACVYSTADPSKHIEWTFENMLDTYDGSNAAEAEEIPATVKNLSKIKQLIERQLGITAD